MRGGVLMSCHTVTRRDGIRYVWCGQITATDTAAIPRTVTDTCFIFCLNFWIGGTSVCCASISVPSPWIYRVSHNWVLTLFCLFSRLPMLIQRFILPFFNSPGDDDSKTHLTFLPISKIDQVTEQNVEQPWFRYKLDKPCMYQKNNIYIQFASRFAL